MRRPGPPTGPSSPRREWRTTGAWSQVRRTGDVARGRPPPSGLLRFSPLALSPDGWDHLEPPPFPAELASRPDAYGLPGRGACRSSRSDRWRSRCPCPGVSPHGRRWCRPRLLGVVSPRCGVTNPECRRNRADRCSRDRHRLSTGADRSGSSPCSVGFVAPLRARGRNSLKGAATSVLRLGVTGPTTVAHSVSARSVGPPSDWSPLSRYPAARHGHRRRRWPRCLGARSSPTAVGSGGSLAVLLGSRNGGPKGFVVTPGNPVWTALPRLPSSTTALAPTATPRSPSMPSTSTPSPSTERRSGSMPCRRRELGGVLRPSRSGSPSPTARPDRPLRHYRDHERPSENGPPT